jgi:hypothetical protein
MQKIIVLLFLTFEITLSAQQIFFEDFNNLSNFDSWQKSPEVEYAFILGSQGSNFVRFHPTYNNRYIISPNAEILSGKYALVFEWGKNSITFDDSTTISYSVNNGQSWKKIKTIIGGTMREWTKDSTLLQLSNSSIRFRWQYNTQKMYPATYFNIDNVRLVKIPETLATKNLLDIDITVYPNPAQEYLNIKINSDYTKELDLTISDEKGTVISRFTAISRSLSIPLDHYPSGIYICTLHSDNAIYSTTFTKIP